MLYICIHVFVYSLRFFGSAKHSGKPSFFVVFVFFSFALFSLELLGCIDVIILCLLPGVLLYFYWLMLFREQLSLYYVGKSSCLSNSFVVSVTFIL